MIKCAIFDLDGTLADTSEDLGRGAEYVLIQFGREAKWTREDYKKFVGNGVGKLLERAFENTLSPEELEKALEIFKEKYNEILLDNVVLYDGIKAELDKIKNNGTKLAVVTNKPHECAVKMVEALFGKGYFDIILGARDNVAKKLDPASTNETLAKLGVKASDAIFFGDSDVDIYTAKNAGIEAIDCS
ncbi:MAG: HAD-IA family hydrolase [Clostridiales bacterium]|nr:HAD-IA family hydrolase [Clostridiales bacterium]